MNHMKTRIQEAVTQFEQGTLAESARHLLETLGYQSERVITLQPNNADEFMSQFADARPFNQEKALTGDWQSVDILFQLTDAEINQTNQMILLDSAGKTVDNSIIESYLFMAVDLRAEDYTRTQLAQITREVNRLFPMPVMLIFRHGDTLTISIINRRLHKRDRSKDVLEKVTLIKDIRIANPHRAHLEILYDLSLDELHRVHGFSSFVELHKAWQTTLDSSELNKRFFKEVANWYFWAVNEATFPPDAGPEETRSATSVIRLITRLIFVWFLKEKGLVPDALFSRRKLNELLTWDDPNGSTYYKAILQNLFFATLNQEMNTPQKPDNRKFRGTREKGQDQHFMIHNVYRYERCFTHPETALALFADIPFLNGGLFECLDRRVDGKTVRVDGFSDRADNPLRVPDELFWGDERDIDLNKTYDTSGRRYTVRGIIHTLNRYKFTITENTPIEEEIALDPELLGKVFENLLAAYNPETGTTARKQTGSFYTPREIVNYMVDESLIAYLETRLRDGVELGEMKDLNVRLRHLFAYNEEPHQLSEAEVAALIDAIDHVNILDPACGSGAFPMGILHKLVFILAKLDPGNERWRAQQLEKEIQPVQDDIRIARRISDEEAREAAIQQLRDRLREIGEKFERNDHDYPRKLFLIENCIYGVDIQPVAVQIAKLRFFISLVVDQRIDDGAPNQGILPLPNLETKFVAANTLLGIEKPKQMALRNPAITRLERELEEVRSKHFRARTPRTKEKWRAEDKHLRTEISKLLRQEGGLHDDAVKQLAAWDPYDQNASADFFDMEWMFGLEQGFDVVIGNPPYVRQEKIKELKPLLKEQYTCYTGTADLYVYFIEVGYNLLRSDGVLCYICSNKYFRAGYGKKLRSFLGKNTTVRELIDFGDAPVFTAIAYPSIITFQKASPNGNRLTAFNWEPGPPVAEFEPIMRQKRFEMPQIALTRDGWRLERPEVRGLLEKLLNTGQPLDEYIGGRFYRGIVTGLNKAFVVDRATRDRLIAEHSSSAELLKPYLRGQDIKRWYVDYANLYVIFTRRGTEIDRYPAIKNYLLQYKERLTPKPTKWKGTWPGRKAGSYKWFEIQDNIAYWQEFEEMKIVWGNLATEPKFTFAAAGFYVNAPANLIVSDSKFLLGILNSRVTEYLVSQSAAVRQGGYLEFKPMYVTAIPVVMVQEEEKAKIEKLVQQVLTIKQDNSSADVSGLEQEIDQHVYRLYGLTASEIAIVEGRDPADTPQIARLHSEQDSHSPMDAAVTAVPPLMFTGQAPQGSMTEKLARIEKLIEQATPAAIQELTAALGDANLTVRWKANAGLRKIGGAQVAGVVQAFLAHTDDPVAREEAERVLRSLNNE